MRPERDLSDAANAEALLRRFEPVIHFTKGEWFYPMDSEPYVRACSLWVRRPDEEAVCVVPAGELTLENLGQQPLDDAEAVHYLYISPPEEAEKPGFWSRLFRRRKKGRPGLAQRDLQGRPRASRARRIHLAPGRRPLLPDAAGQGQGPRRERGVGQGHVRQPHAAG